MGLLFMTQKIINDIRRKEIKPLQKVKEKKRK